MTFELFELGMEPRFIVDSNAGKLAKWLRMMGYDTVYFQDGPDREMLGRALAEKRILLTRDTNLFKRRLVSRGEVKAILLKDDDPEKQLKHVMASLNLDTFRRLLSRCLECNELLEPVDPEEVKDVVPPYVFQKQASFFRCPACRRVYWGGSHRKAIEARLEKLTAEKKP